MSCNFLADLLAAFGVEELTRVGARFFHILPHPSFEQLTSTLNKNLYRPEFSHLFPEKKDVGAAIIAKAGQNEYYFRSGPVTKDELVSRASIEFPADVLPPAGLFIDLDYRRTERAKYNVRSFVTEAHRFVETKAKEYVRFVED